MRLYSATTGHPEEVPEADVPQALASQQYGLPAGTLVPVQTQDGELSEVPIEQLHEPLSKGASVVSPEAWEMHKLQATHGGGWQQAAAGAEGLASGATLGLSDLAESTLLGNTEDIEKRRKANPWTAGVGTVAGALLPTLLAPETGAGEVEEAGALGNIGRVIGAPARGVARAGGAVEDAVHAALGAGENDSWIAALAKNAAAKGAGAATEGAIYGATQHLDEQMLGDPNAAGESLLAATGHGALLGLGLGGALGATGELGAQVLGRVAPHLSGQAEELAVHAVSGKAARELADLPGGVRAAGRRLLDDGVIKAGETGEEIAAKLPAMAEKYEAQAAKMLQTADEAGHEGVSVQNILRDGEKELASLRAHPTGEAAANALDKQLRGIERIAGVPTEEKAAGILGAIGGERAMFIEHAKFSFKEAGELQAKLEGPLRGIVRREIDEAAEKSVKTLGGTFADDYRDASLAVSQYRALAAAPPTERKGLEGLVGLGLLSHGPIGAAHGLAIGLAKRFAQERGASTGAVVLDKLAALRGAERAIQRTDREIARGVDALVGSGKRAAMRVGKASGSSYEQRVEAVQRAARDPAGAAVTAASPIAPHAPRVAAAFRAAAVRTTNLLASLVPKVPQSPSLTPQLQPKHTPSLQARAKFMREFDAAHDPKTVLKAAAEGTITPDMVAVASKSHPALWGKMTKAVETKLRDATHPLTTQQRTNVGILLGVPTHTPDVARAFQATFAESTGPGGAPPSQNQDAQHRNKDRYGSAPKRPITATAKNVALSVGRPQGT